MTGKNYFRSSAIHHNYRVVQTVGSDTVVVATIVKVDYQIVIIMAYNEQFYKGVNSSF